MTGFRCESIRHHRPGATWQLERQVILICRDALGLWCGAQRRQTVFRWPDQQMWVSPLFLCYILGTVFTRGAPVWSLSSACKTAYVSS